jgi:uncharacterized BrkB/YihY/UPF0761 family membrane protein
MENNQTQTPVPAPIMTQEQMLQEIYENTRKTKNYMKWSLYITIVLVVLPLLAALVIIPFAMSSLNSAYLAPLQGLQ